MYKIVEDPAATIPVIHKLEPFGKGSVWYGQQRYLEHLSFPFVVKAAQTITNGNEFVKKVAAYFFGIDSGVARLVFAVSSAFSWSQRPSARSQTNLLRGSCSRSNPDVARM